MVETVSRQAIVRIRWVRPARNDRRLDEGVGQFEVLIGFDPMGKRVSLPLARCFPMVAFPTR